MDPLSTSVHLAGGTSDHAYTGKGNLGYFIYKLSKIRKYTQQILKALVKYGM